MSTETFSSVKSKSLTTKVIGVGGAGSNAVDHMIQSGMIEVTFAAIQTNQRIHDNPRISNRILIGSKRLHGMGTGGDPDLARNTAAEEFDAIKEFCADADLIFVVTGLGGGTGTGIAPLVARAAKEAGALVLSIATLPFDFEGPRRRKQAEIGLQQLKASADAVITFPNQKLFKLIDENTSLLEAFKFANNLISQGVRGVLQMLTRPGLIHVDFAYLYAAVRGKCAESTFAAAEAQGDNRARDVVAKILANPLLDQGKALTEANTILVSLVGGSDMTMADVNRVMEGLTRETDTGQIIMGAAIDPAFQGSLGLTLVVTRTAPSLKELEADGSEQESAGIESGQVPSAGENRLSGPVPTECATPPEIETAFFEDNSTPRPPSRFVPPAPQLTPQKKAEMLTQQGRSSPTRKVVSKFKQQQLPLEIVSRGRFEKSEPTIHRGEDLDVPTYVRRGVALN